MVAETYDTCADIHALSIRIYVSRKYLHFNH